LVYNKDEVICVEMWHYRLLVQLNCDALAGLESSKSQSLP